MSTESVLAEVLGERRRQDAKWGEQNHPDGTGRYGDKFAAVEARKICDAASGDGSLTYRDILREEVAEAFAESDPAKLRAELIQVAAVCMQWVEKLDREARSALKESA